MKMQWEEAWEEILRKTNEVSGSGSIQKGIESNSGVLSPMGLVYEEERRGKNSDN
jgi:hypothetical protein